MLCSTTFIHCWSGKDETVVFVNPFNLTWTPDGEVGCWCELGNGLKRVVAMRRQIDRPIDFPDKEFSIEIRLELFFHPSANFLSNMHSGKGFRQIRTTHFKKQVFLPVFVHEDDSIREPAFVQDHTLLVREFRVVHRQVFGELLVQFFFGCVFRIERRCQIAAFEFLSLERIRPRHHCIRRSFATRV